MQAIDNGSMRTQSNTSWNKKLLKWPPKRPKNTQTKRYVEYAYKTHFICIRSELAYLKQSYVKIARFIQSACSRGCQKMNSNFLM